MARKRACAPTEWQMHHRLLELRADAQAIVHCHSRHATILACAGRFIPSVHYIVGVRGRPCVPLAPYVPFAWRELGDIVPATVGGAAASLMADHALVTLGPTLERALSIAEQIKEQAAVHFGAWQIGGPHLLSDEQTTDVLERLSRP
jgi:L-fuculose-phosphate aldolase